MKSNFLDRFTGKTQILSKRGLESVLQGDADELYTNTLKSFRRDTKLSVSTHKTSDNKILASCK
jgi:hypothetical protein